MTTDTLVLAHASDLHVPGPWSKSPITYLPALWLAAGFHRLTGRTQKHPESVARALARDLAGDASIDHVALTGDFTNLSFDAEFDAVADALEPLAARGEGFVSAIPGNHDRMTFASVRRRSFERALGAFALSDDGRDGDARYPYLRLRKGVAIVGVDSAVPNPFGGGKGLVGDRQLGALDALLAARAVREARFRVLLVHHAPFGPDGARDRASRRLRDDHALLEACGRGRVDLVLHGHVHCPYAFEVERAGHRFLSVGAGSSTQLGSSPSSVAGYHVYVIEGARLARIEARTYVQETGRFEGRRELVRRPARF